MRGSKKVFLVWILVVVAALFSLSVDSLARQRRPEFGRRTCSCGCKSEDGQKEGTYNTEVDSYNCDFLKEGIRTCYTSGEVGTPFAGKITDCVDLGIATREGARGEDLIPVTEQTTTIKLKTEQVGEDAIPLTEQTPTSTLKNESTLPLHGR